MYPHQEICKKALDDNDIFNNFKKEEKYRSILEHVSYTQDNEYFKEIINGNLNLDLNWEKYFENDKIGNPIKHDYIIKGKNYNISPSTLRYISTGIKIMLYIKNKLKLSELSIVEIGGGYGGQCKILFDLGELFNIKINKYHIIDLEYVSNFQEKYLNSLGLVNNNIKCFNNLEYKEKIDNYNLLISNYALGEFEKSIQDDYIENVLSKCDNYYLLWNTNPINDLLIDPNKIEESPQTNHSRDFKNLVLTNL